MLNKLKQSWLKIVVFCVLGIILSIIIGKERDYSFLVHTTNAVFSAGLVLLIIGIAHQLTNMHMFTSLTYSVKLVKNIIRNKHSDPEERKNDFIEYRNSRKHHDDVSVYLLCAGVLIALSVLLSLFSV